MRAYFAADAELLGRLREGGTYTGDLQVATSDDELDEFDAMTAAAQPDRAVVAVEVDQPHQPVGLADVAAFHVDADGSGDLAWYAAEEIDQVVGLLG